MVSTNAHKAFAFTVLSHLRCVKATSQGLSIDINEVSRLAITNFKQSGTLHLFGRLRLQIVIKSNSIMMFMSLPYSV